MGKAAAISSKITAQGQVSVPAAIRKQLAVGPGSVLEWQVQGEQVVVKRAGRYTFEDIHKALFKTPPKYHSLEELKAAVGDAIAEEYLRKNARR